MKGNLQKSNLQMNYFTLKRYEHVNNEEIFKCTSSEVLSSSGYSSVTKPTSDSGTYVRIKHESVAWKKRHKVQPVLNHGPSLNNKGRDLSLPQKSSRTKPGLKKEDEDKIRQHFCYLKKNLDPDSGILDHCIEQNIIKDDHVELINAEPARHRKVDCLLRKLLQTQHNTFPMFLDILMATGNGHIKKTLESEMRDDSIADCETEDRKGVHSWKASNALKKYTKEIIKELQPEVVMDYLFKYGQFSLDEYEEVTSKKTRKKQVVQLMKILATDRHMPRGYTILIKALQDDQQLYLYELLDLDTMGSIVPNTCTVNVVTPDVEFLQTDESSPSDEQCIDITKAAIADDDMLLITVELRIKDQKKQEDILRKVNNKETRQKINDILFSETSCLMQSITKGSIIIKLKGCTRSSIKRLLEKGYETGVSRILGIILSSPEVKQHTENQTFLVTKVQIQNTEETKEDFEAEKVDYKKVLRNNITFLKEELDPSSFLHLAIFTKKEKGNINETLSASRSEGTHCMIKFALTKSDDDLRVLLEEIKLKKLYVWEFMFKYEHQENPREKVTSNYSILVENICPSLIADHCAQSDLLCIETYQLFVSQGKPRTWITKFILQEVLKKNDEGINRFLQILSTFQQNLYSMVMAENGSEVLSEEDQGVDSETDWTEDDKEEEETHHTVKLKGEGAENDGGYTSMSPKRRRKMLTQLSTVPATSINVRQDGKEDDSGYSPMDKMTILRGLASYPDEEGMPESEI